VAKTFPDQSLDPISSYRKAHALLRYRESQSGMRAVIFAH